MEIPTNAWRKSTRRAENALEKKAERAKTKLFYTITKEKSSKKSYILPFSMINNLSSSRKWNHFPSHSSALSQEFLVEKRIPYSISSHREEIYGRLNDFIWSCPHWEEVLLSKVQSREADHYMVDTTPGLIGWGLLYEELLPLAVATVGFSCH